MSKKAIQIIASEETYRNLTTFSNITDLNHTVRSYKEQFADQLNKTQVAVLDLLHRFSAKYKGVSFLSKSNIAEKVGKSRRTIIRVCQALEVLGIIKQYETKRATDCQQTSNAVVIQPVKTIVPNTDYRKSVTQEPEQIVTPEDNTSQKQKQNNKNNVEPTLIELDSSYLGKDIPKPFIDAAKVFFPEAQSIHELWQKVRIAYKRTNIDTTLDQLTHDIVGVFKSSIFSLKRGAIRKDFKGYFFKACERTFDEVYSEELVELIAREGVAV
ncbi:helix-turn-helix domain-containing protein [Halalkalibacter okhensis]|uniref:helix-turn-helix domain-containing protein n=1 Tax=Halalkalibacter okhensis TaxID=333138 RepID=UPI00068BA17C|nr:helix-turn-helix domain-containing protein [Halalkalibacter okhensis]